jgi:hypothetical protein
LSGAEHPTDTFKYYMLSVSSAHHGQQMLESQMLKEMPQQAPREPLWLFLGDR